MDARFVLEYSLAGLLLSSVLFACNGSPPSDHITIPPQTPSASDTGLEFPSNPDIANGSTVRFKFTNPQTRGLPIYGPGGTGVTYIFRVYPKQQSGYYTTFFWGNDDGQDTLATFLWKNGVADTYYGMHPYPDGGGDTTATHKWEVSIEQDDFVNGAVVMNQWYTQAVRVWSDGSGKHHEFYWDLPKTDAAHRVTRNSLTSANSVNPPSPALTFGDAPWQPGNELCSCILRGIQIYAAKLSLTDIQNEIAVPKSTAVGASTIWYLNVNPTPTDISDKSGKGHNPEWVGNLRPMLYTGH